MPQERSNEWGLTPIEYAQRDKQRLRERMKKRMQRARMKLNPPPMICEHPVQNFSTFTLKGQDVQDLGIIAVVTKVIKKQNPIGGWREPIDIPISLPWVSLIYGERAA